MSQRYTQDRATTQRHLAILKDLLKQPDNKLCADCKRNDPRWASTNLGVFMCIRCSGHHRGMGVHISRVRSVDLDTWTPEQIQHMERWGNRRANLYWEAHLKPGHMPPDHKIESFIRSKYELKRWAREGPIPEPEQLDGGAEATPAAEHESAPASARVSSRKAAPTTSLDLLSSGGGTSGSSPSSASSSSRKATPQPTKSKPAEASLLNLDFGTPAPTATTSAPAPRTAHHVPQQQQAAPSSAPAPRRDPKADILSLFNAAPPMRPAPQQAPPSYASNGSGGAGGGLANDFASLSFGSGGGGSSGLPRSTSTNSDFGGFASAPMPPPVPVVHHSAANVADPWASSATTTTSSSSSSVWGNPAPPSSSSNNASQTSSYHAAPAAAAAASKPDPFADFGAFTAPAASSSAAGGTHFGGDIWASSSSTTSSTAGAKNGGGGFSDIWN
ncbi:hypothetical protein JCM10908_007247 [Rhodotorula pacifica]|uniref:uncharacterized protein n=1 Tax=Rhodotorula pacifica TaxID=1495444 RepID=UPI003180B194